MLLSSRIRVPDDTGALLWDMDGVVLDTLSMELGVVQALIAQHIPHAPAVSREAVRRQFALSIPDFWRALLVDLTGTAPSDAVIDRLSAALREARETLDSDVLPGVRDLLTGAWAAGLRVAVVSNNPAAHVEELLARAGLSGQFEQVIGNDQGLPGKPAPDMYLAGAAAVGLMTQQCVALEDSLIGAQAARAAGCFVVGVATGAATFAELEAATVVDVAYRAFTPSIALLSPGDVTAKTLDTPNEFVSHMLEHIAWRTGCSMTLAWANDDWDWLGHAVGEQLAVLLDADVGEARALGLIDDGSCEVTLERTRADRGLVLMTGSAPAAGAQGEGFVAMRVEQLATGRPLVRVLEGLARACDLTIRIDIASLEDPHHTWEAIFRAVGVALRQLSRTLVAHADGTGDTLVTRDDGRAAKGYGLRIESASPDAVRAVRTTAESVCVADVTAVAGGTLILKLATSPSVHCEGLIALVARLGSAAGLTGTIDFSALELSSSHVVAEDVGMTLGAALKELATQRMDAFGIEGAGSSFGTGAGRLERHDPIRVGVSWEGRKFLQLVPIGWTHDALREQLIGSTLSSGLFSEDLDDFLDGFVGGMGCSVVVHWEPVAHLDAAWELVFSGLGTALAGLLAPNHAKRALIAGVKATLA